MWAGIDEIVVGDKQSALVILIIEIRRNINMISKLKSTIHSLMYTIQYTIYIVHYTVYTVHGVYYSLYRVQSIHFGQKSS